MVNVSGILFAILYFCSREKHFDHIRNRIFGVGYSGNLLAATAYYTVVVTLGMALCAKFSAIVLMADESSAVGSIHQKL